MLKRGLSLFLCICMIASSMPLHSFAQVENVVNNDLSVNEMIKSELEKLTSAEDGISKDSVLIKLMELGLLDGNGDLVSMTISIDGEEKTLDEAKTIVEAEDVDLTKGATVEGVSISLEQLKIIIEIEEELLRIETNFWGESGVQITDAHNEALASLVAQLNNDGISATMAGSEITVDSSTVDRDVKVVVAGYGYGSNNKIWVDFELRNSNNDLVKIDDVLSMNYVYVDGSCNVEELSSTITIDANTDRVRKEIPYNITDNINHHIGDKKFLLSFSGLENALFANGQTATSLVCSYGGNYNYRDVYNNVVTQISPLDDAIIKLNQKAWVDKNDDGVFDIGGDNPAAWCYLADFGRFFTDAYDDNDTHIYTYDKKQAFNDLLKAGIITHLTPPKLISWDNLKLDNIGATPPQLEIHEEVNGVISYKNHYEISAFHKTNGHVWYTSEAMNAFIPLKDRYWNANNEDANIPPDNQAFNISGGDIQNLIFKVWHDNPDKEPRFHDGELNVQLLDRTKGVGPMINSDGINYRASSGALRPRDRVKPSILSTTTNTGKEYEIGETVPVVITFTEPIFSWDPSRSGSPTRIAYKLKTGEKDGSVLYSAEKYVDSLEYSPYQGKQLTFGIPVEEHFAGLVITGISQYVDTVNLVGDAISMNVPLGVNAMPQYEDVFDDYSITKSGNEIELAFNLNTKFPEAYGWIGIEASKEENKEEMLLPSLTAKVVSDEKNNDVVTFSVDKLFEPTKVTAKFRVPANTTSVDYKYIPAIFYNGSDNKEDEANKEIFYNLKKSYVLEPTIYLKKNEFALKKETWVDDEDVTQYLDELLEAKKFLKLGVEVTNPGATYVSATDFTYISSNERIASIDNTGKIFFTGSNGSVYFMVKANNGGAITKQYTHKTKPINIKAGISPFLLMQEGANIFTANRNETAEIRWMTNIVQKKIDEEVDTNSTYEIEIFEISYEGDARKKGTSVFTDSFNVNKDNERVSYKIPTNILDHISEYNKQTYAVEVKLDGLTTTGYIEVKSRPALVKLNKPESLFIRDNTDAITIDFKVDDFDDVNPGSTFELVITKNENEIYTNSNIGDRNKSYELILEDVAESDLKDVYTVNVSAMNVLDQTLSFDSYILYVYNNDALKLQYKGVDAPESLILDNNPIMTTKTSQDILDLNRNIYIGGELSTNKDDYEWSALGDMMAWQSSDSTKATLNVQILGITENIKQLNYDYYAPNRDFILNGVANGETDISATHGYSKMTDSMKVTVNSLKDKLYLINVYPKATSHVKYINGDDVEVTVDTNAKGEIAIYEESGIKSDLWFKTTTESDTYLGTIFNKDLQSGERDLSKAQLYPMNLVELLAVSKPIITLKGPDGAGYNGTVQLTGGVYRNGEYCSSVSLNGENALVEQAITVTNGKLEIEMDVTQFRSASYTEPLNPSDKLDFVYYVQADGHEPILIYADGNKNFEEVKEQAGNTYKFKEATPSELSVPVIKRNVAKFVSGEEIEITKNVSRVGPNKNTGQVELITEIICLGGAKGDDYTASMIDQFDTTPSGASVEIKEYPFIDVPVLQHKQILNKDTLWMPDRASRSISMRVFKEGKEITKLPFDFRIINLVNMDINDANEITDMPRDLKGKITQKNNDYGKGDQIVSKVLTAVGSVEGLDTTMIKMMISPTSDPTVFNTLISVDIGYGDVGGIEDKDGGTFVTGPTADAGDIEISGVEGSKVNAKDFSPSTYKNMANNFNGKRMVGVSPVFEGGGYIKGNIIYNFDKQKWEMNMTANNINATAGVNIQVLFNTIISGIPFTAEFSTTGSVGFSYSSAYQYGDIIEDKYGEEFVSDYLKTLRFDLYVYAFGGVGIDYSVVKIKMGLFGEQDLSYEQRWLEQEYLPKKSSYGTELRTEGVVGIKFQVKFLFSSYEKIIASGGYSSASTSGDWHDINDYWAKYGNGSIQNGDLITGLDEAFKVVHESVVLEDRAYLEQFDRKWHSNAVSVSQRLKSDFSIMSLDTTSEVSNLQTNAYPYSDPTFTSDGELLGYISDMDSSDVTESRVCISTRSGSTYLPGQKISDVYTSYGDNSLSLDGTKNHAVATWITQISDVKKDANQALTEEDVTMINNSSEIMASVFDGATWTTPIRLTNNGNSESSPIAMTNGSETVIAYRSMYAADASNPFDYGDNDEIVYRVYDGINKTWSDEKVMYNGTLGNIKGLDGKMLSDGTASIVYTVEKKVENRASTKDDYEVMYAIIDKDGSLVNSVVATNDSYCDENPKITSHKFADGEERFVLGWFSTRQQSDLRLLAFNNEGFVYNGFVDSLSETLQNSSTNITPKFQFAKGDVDDDLTIVWSKSLENSVEDINKSNKGALDALKIIQQGASFYATSVCNLAEMADYTSIDFFSSRVDHTGKVKSLILGSDYNTGVTEVYDTGVVATGKTESTKVNVAVGVSGLYTATGVFGNDIRIEGAEYDYSTIVPEMEIPVNINIYNDGIDSIESVQLDFAGENKSFDFAGAPILSGSSKVLTLMYTIPDVVENIAYSVSATFTNGDTKSKSDKIYMYFPGTGLSKLELATEGNTKRDVSYTLYNDTRIGLKTGDYRVAVRFYDNQNQEGTALKEVFITSADDFALIEAGLYNGKVTFDVNDFLKDDEEIPGAGIKVYCTVNVEERTDGVYKIMPELNKRNNEKVVTFESLINKSNNEMVTVKTVQRKDGDDTVVDVTVKNNSLVKETSGNIIVSTFDNSGAKTDTLQGFDSSEINKGLVKLGPEETTIKSFRFVANNARSNEVVYSDAIIDGNNADLGALQLEGHEITFDRNTVNYSVFSKEKIHSKLSITTSNPGSTVTIDGLANTSGQADVLLDEGQKTLDVVVTSADGSVTKSYKILLVIKGEETAPSVIITSPISGITMDEKVDVNFKFSEHVSDFTVEDITVINGTKEEFSGSKDSYSVKIQPTIDGQVKIYVDAGQATNYSKVGNAKSNTLVFESERMAPIIDSYYPAVKERVRAQQLTLAIGFNEALEKGSGKLTIYDSNHKEIKVIDAASDEVVIDDKMLKVNTNHYFADANYYVLMDAGFIKDAVGNGHVGITNKNQWQFSTYTPSSSSSRDEDDEETTKVDDTIKPSSPNGEKSTKITMEITTMDIAKKQFIKENGKDTGAVLFTLDETKLAAKIIQAEKLFEKEDTEGKEKEIKISLGSDDESSSVVGQLSGSMIKSMANKPVILEVKTKNATYALPANEISAERLSEAAGQAVSLKGARVNVKISDTPADMVSIVENTENASSFSLLVPPVDFEVTCVYKDGYTEKSVQLEKFSAYIERLIAIPSTVDHTKITTGIVINEDGTTHPVPTQIIQIDGKYYAKIKSRTNSTYTLVSNPKAYGDTKNHWGQVVCDDMSSRMIVLEDEKTAFSPDRPVTRLEFLSSLVRALGLSGKTSKSAFTDVDKTVVDYEYVSAGVEYKLTDGYDDNTFRGDQLVSREEAAAFIIRAMKIAELQTEYPEASLDGQLDKFIDGSNIEKWAREYVEICAINNIFQGNDKKEFLPKDNITKAELATIINRMMEEAGLL